MIRAAALALLAIAGAAAPAFGETVVYACKIERRIEGQDVQVYSPTLRADPSLRFRFAVDAVAGKGCRLDGMTCMPLFSVLNVTSDASGIKGAGQRLTDGVAATLTFSSGGQMSFVVAGSVNGHAVNSQTIAGVGDCAPTGEVATIR